MRPLLLLLAFFGFGCGPWVDPRFDGAWHGTASVLVSGYESVNSDAYLTIHARDGTVTASGFCPGGGGVISGPGDGAVFEWNGFAKCSATVMPNCPSAEIHLTSVRLELLPIGTMHAAAAANSSGCNDMKSTSILLDAAKVGGY
jgi:hypothetical protein